MRKLFQSVLISTSTYISGIVNLLFWKCVGKRGKRQGRPIVSETNEEFGVWSFLAHFLFPSIIPSSWSLWIV